MNKKYDVIFVGLGFANGILAYRLKQVKPDLKMLIIEQKKDLGGDYTWSFFSSDIEPSQMEWVRPLIKHRWPKHELIFPKFSRMINGEYNAIPSEILFENIKESGIDVMLGKKALEINSKEVLIEGGGRIQANCVFDGRGPRANLKFSTGYQKFVGIDIEIEKPHGQEHPIIMDVKLEQEDGFRFMYVLPWTKTSLMLEDTHYSDTADYDIEYYKKKMLQYAAVRGWKVKKVTRVEHGALLIPMEGDPDLKVDFVKGVPPTGIRAGLYHPITSYASSSAIKLAEFISKQPDIESAAMCALIKENIKKLIKYQSVSFILNRMIFRVAVPEKRYKILQYFYTKNDGMVKRFYASTMKLTDYLNLCFGVPPVNIMRIFRMFMK